MSTPKPHEKDDSIREMLAQRMSIRVIKRVLGVSQRRIDRARSTPKGTCTIVKRQPTKVTPEVRTLIEAETLADGTLHDQQLADKIGRLTGVTISHDSVRRVRHELGFNYRPKMAIQELTEVQKKQRLDFCHWILANNEVDFQKIVFTDESRFCAGPDNSWCYIRRGDWNEGVMAKKQKFPRSVMFFGGIGHGWKSRLVPCRGTVDSKAYIENLQKSGLLDEMDQRHGPFHWLLMQDGATSHTSRETMDWLRRNINVLPGWPPNSPDLNPIEMLWAVVKRKRHAFPGTLEEQVLAAWDSIAQETIDRLVADFRHRCEMVMNVGGCSISQYLSSHIEPEHRDWPKPEYQEVDDGISQVIELMDNRRLDDLSARFGLSCRELRSRIKVVRERQLMARQFRRLPSISVFAWPPE